NDSEERDTKLKIVVTTTVLGDFTERVGGDKIELTILDSSGMCPIDYDIKPEHILAVENAKLLLKHGVPGEAFLQKILDSATTIPPINTVGNSPWNLPSNALLIVDNITDALKDIDPNSENDAYYAQNAEDLKTEISNTADEIKQEAEQLNVSDIKVISMIYWKAFLTWLGYNVTGSFDGKHTASEMQTLVDMAKDENVSMVISNYQSGIEYGATIAQEAGISHVELTNFPGPFGVDSYVEMLRYDADKLFHAGEEDEDSWFEWYFVPLIAIPLALAVVFIIIRERRTGI
ncbi:MAG: metal ABC transporter substrate-binding protein, partial [Asgard group archaeon]